MDADQLAEIGRRVVEAREARGWNQRQLADATELTDSTIRKVEKGNSVKPGTLRKVLDAVGIEPLVEQQERIGYPRDVQALLDLVGMYLVALPESERVRVAFETTQFLNSRRASSERPQNGR
jgi:transcriptional regulator with XRE-family HTH domain